MVRLAERPTGTTMILLYGWSPGAARAAARAGEQLAAHADQLPLAA